MTKRIAFYGGTFDPVHCGHTDVAEGVVKLFGIDEFVFIPAFHAPHKQDNKPTSAFQRFAMLCEATDRMERMRVSTIELELPEKPYTIETLSRLKESFPGERLFFVIGADSWEEITTWREWEQVLLSVDIVVMTRPGYDIGFSHISDEIREKVVDLRGNNDIEIASYDRSVFVTDAVYTDISATNVRRLIREEKSEWKEMVGDDVAQHIEKYKLYR